jgi:hypothetical protein
VFKIYKRDNQQYMADITGRVVIEAIPKDDEGKKKLAAFLMRHSEHATPDSIALMLSQLPVVLAKKNLRRKRRRTCSHT